MLTWSLCASACPLPSDGSCSMEIQACHPASTEPATLAVNTSMETLMHSDAVRKESLGRVPTRRRLISRWFTSAALMAGVLGPAVAVAQTSPTSKAETPGKSGVQAATIDASATPSNQAAAPWQKMGLNGAMRLEFHGTAAVDVGYDKYTFPDNAAVQPNTPD